MTERKRRKTARKTNEYTRHNKVRIVRGGSDYFNSIEEIADNAQYTIHLQTYIFDEDETGKKVAAALIRAANRNVTVHTQGSGYPVCVFPTAGHQ